MEMIYTLIGLAAMLGGELHDEIDDAIDGCLLLPDRKYARDARQELPVPSLEVRAGCARGEDRRHALAVLGL